MVQGGSGNQEDTERFGGKFSKTHSFLSSALLLFILLLGENQQAFPPPKKKYLTYLENIFFGPQVKNKGALANPACLDLFANIPETKIW